VFNPAYLTISRHRLYYFRWPLPPALHPQGRQSTIKVSLRKASDSDPVGLELRVSARLSDELLY
jgi:hypothetical protein